MKIIFLGLLAFAVAKPKGKYLLYKKNYLFDITYNFKIPQIKWPIAKFVFVNFVSFKIYVRKNFLFTD